MLDWNHGKSFERGAFFARSLALTIELIVNYTCDVQMAGQ